VKVYYIGRGVGSLGFQIGGDWEFQFFNGPAGGFGGCGNFGPFWKRDWPRRTLTINFLKELPRKPWVIPKGRIDRNIWKKGVG